MYISAVFRWKPHLQLRFNEDSISMVNTINARLKSRLCLIRSFLFYNSNVYHECLNYEVVNHFRGDNIVTL